MLVDAEWLLDGVEMHHWMLLAQFSILLGLPFPHTPKTNAAGGGRTHPLLRAQGPQPCLSTKSSTAAKWAGWDSNPQFPKEPDLQSGAQPIAHPAQTSSPRERGFGDLGSDRGAQTLSSPASPSCRGVRGREHTSDVKETRFPKLKNPSGRVAGGVRLGLSLVRPG